MAEAHTDRPQENNWFCGAFQPLSLVEQEGQFMPYRCTELAGHITPHRATVDGEAAATWGRLW